MIEYKNFEIYANPKGKPDVYNIKRKDSDVKSHFICPLPQGNCQTVLIGYGMDIIDYNYTKEEVNDYLKLILKYTNKRQLLFDVQIRIAKKLKRKLKPFSKKIITRNYISTNGSEMTILIVQLDINKLN